MIRDIGWFAATILQQPLYPYQIEAGNAILESIRERRGDTFTVMMSRQSGKNQLSAVLEAYLLFAYDEGTVVKAAPTWRPQIINSMLRLKQMLNNPFMHDREWGSFGYIIGIAPSPELIEAKIGPKIFFFSAAPESNIVGATASLLLEIDEAQDVTPEKYDVELKPMGATNNATTVMYGTAWSDDTLLAQMSTHNLEREHEDGIKRHFEFDYTHLARINPHYKRFVEGEIERLGEDHISIRTQYRLIPISGAGYLLNDLQRQMIRGSHAWQSEPGEGYYVASCDVGGEQRPKPGDESRAYGKRDSTVVSIGRVSTNELGLPKLELVHQHHWTGMKQGDQFAAISTIMQEWNIRRLVIDSTGLGEGLSSLLADRFGEERVTCFKFSRTSKSQVTYLMLGMVNGGRLKIYAQEGAPGEIYQECWTQLRKARYLVPGEGLLTMFVAESDGHDDYLLSIGLCCEATREFAPPPVRSAIIKPKRVVY